MDTVRDWVRVYLAKSANIPLEEVSLERNLGDFGLDSVDAILMAGDLEEAFGVEINPASFLQYETFEQMICSVELALGPPLQSNPR